MLRATVFLVFACGIASAQSTPVQYSLVRELRVDANAEDFGVLGPVRVSARGDMALTFGREREVWVYDAQGKQIARFGSRGGGPGEFQRPQVQGWIGDTVWVFDHELQRITLVTREGRLIRTSRLPAAVLPATRVAAIPPGRIASAFAPHMLSATGEMLGVAAVAPERLERGQEAPMGAISVAQNGESRIIALAPPYEDRWEWIFAFRPQIAFSADGQRIAFISVDSYAREGGTFRVVQVDSRGDTTFVRSYPYAGEVIPQRVIDSVTSLPASRGPDGPRVVPRSRIPPVFAPVEGIGFSREAAVWVEFRATQSGKRVMVLGGNGEVAAEFVMPATGRLAGLSATHAWIRESDDDGLTSVVRYRLRR